MLLYHLVTDDFPVKAATFSELVSAHARGEITPLQDVRPHLPNAFVRGRRESDRARPGKTIRQRWSVGGRTRPDPRIQREQGPGPATQDDLNEGRNAPRKLRVRARHGRSVGRRAALHDMSPAKDQECFCEGMTDELINALTQISGLRVAARTSAFQFKGQARDIRQIGDALNVATVLDGSVRKDGNRLRITVELIGSADGYHLWSQRFDRDLVDVFAVQDEIAGSVVSMLKGRLAADKGAAIVAPHSRDLDAYGFYLEGRYHWNKRTEDELKKSVGVLRTGDR